MDGIRHRQCTVRELAALATARAAEPADAEPDDDSDTIDDEPAIRLRVTCPARVRALWRRALELASRVSGEPLATWRAAEVIAAEAFSGRPADVAFAERALRATAKLRASVDGSADGRAEPVGDPALVSRPNAVAGPAATPTGVFGVEPSAPAPDAFALAAQLQFAMDAIRTAEPRIGHLLDCIVRHRFYRTLGYASLAAYAGERLGISARKAWALLKVEKSAWRADAFGRAYHGGTLSWSRAVTLLPVLARDTEEAWLARAQAVTVRRLADEVNYVLEARDLLGPDVPLAPPPLDSALPSAVAKMFAPPRSRVQMGARSRVDAIVARQDSAARAGRELCDAAVEFVGPASVVGVFRDAMDAYAHPGESRWLALEHMLRHVLAYWEGLPRHPDPIFARDSWRCTVPGCSARRSLHDHHVRWRSEGGGNGRDNRTAVCAAHHLHGVHRGAIHASGEAPHAIHWELGVRRGQPPLLSYIGDRLCTIESEEEVIRSAAI